MSAFSSYAESRREKRRREGRRDVGREGYGGVEQRVERGSGRGREWKGDGSPNSPLASVTGVLRFGIDVLLLVHTVDGRDVLEVLQDRVAGMTGRWGVR